MIISEERQSHLAHLITDGLWKADLVDFTQDDQALRAAKTAIAKFVTDCEDIDKHARQKVASLKRGVVEGSSEWDILYFKYFEEEMQRRGNS